jgi:NAD(P)H-hydrate epimerase
MKIPSAQQMRAWDVFTISHEPIRSDELMERAAGACARELWQRFGKSMPYYIFCGTGNNGGDGLAIARFLLQQGAQVNVYQLPATTYSDDCLLNQQRLSSLTSIQTIDEEHLPSIPQQAVVVDALFGTGLNKPVNGVAAHLIQHLNASPGVKVAVDLPSGLMADTFMVTPPVFAAQLTIKFQAPALSFMFPESFAYTGEWKILDIGLHPDYEQILETRYHYTDANVVRSFVKHRNKFDHKGTFGHALLIAGSEDKTGAAVLSAKAALRSGCGLLSVFIPESERALLLSTVPEAMLAQSNNNLMSGITLLPYKAIGIGPGLGKADEVRRGLHQLLREVTLPLVLDADALNIIAEDKLHIPAGSILTPHVKELERLCGRAENSWQRLTLAQQLASQYQVYVVLKGAHTAVVCPTGEVYFNSTGNPGLAKGGSGDVLTGVITSLLAQGYTPKEAALLGVYLHGYAADVVLHHQTVETMLASDVVEELAQGFRSFETH